MRSPPRLVFETKRLTKDTCGGGLVHGWFIGPHLSDLPVRIMWFVFPALSFGAQIEHRLIRSGRARKHPYSVVDVKQETPSVRTVSLSPPAGTTVPAYFPGQFHFVTLLRAIDRRPEQHPFTISSSPTDRSRISSSIKASGDYTATIGKTLVGDKAEIDGPYGRFSYVLYPGETRLAFIAGGIGITPFVSMLRHMRDTKTPREVVLFYGNRTEQEIAFRRELDEIAASGTPRLRIVHILSAAAESWQGLRGYLTPDTIARECGDLAAWSFYLCGPPVMMRMVVKILRGAGVRRSRIRYERFAF